MLSNKIHTQTHKIAGSYDSLSFSLYLLCYTKYGYCDGWLEQINIVK